MKATEGFLHVYITLRRLRDFEKVTQTLNCVLDLHNCPKFSQPAHVWKRLYNQRIKPVIYCLNITELSVRVKHFFTRWHFGNPKDKSVHKAYKISVILHVFSLVDRCVKIRVCKHPCDVLGSCVFLRNTYFYESNRGFSLSLHVHILGSIKHSGWLGEFVNVIQTFECISGLHNCLEFSQPPCVQMKLCKHEKEHFFHVYIASSTHEEGWENLRQLTTSRVCITFENSPSHRVFRWG